MPLTDTAANLALGAVTPTHVGLTTTVPDGSGATEISGGSYARVAVSLAAASSRTRVTSADMNHNIPAGTDVVGYTFWNALTAGTYLGWTPVGPASPVRGVGTVDATGVSANTVASSGHGLAVDMRVVLFSVGAESLPAGLSGTVVYWVKAVTADTFTLSTTQGGAAVDITGQGELAFQQCSPERFVNAGVLNTPAGSLAFEVPAQR
jgi:hypothetical protein